MTLQIWIYSFIPKDIAGYTRTIPASGGKTMIPGPLPVSDCFHTDQRAFSSQPAASSRTRSRIEIDTATMTLAAQNHHCDPTVECDCEDGEEECNKVPDSSNLKITGFQSSGTACSFTFEGGGGKPLRGSPRTRHRMAREGRGQEAGFKRFREARCGKRGRALSGVRMLCVPQRSHQGTFPENAGFRDDTVEPSRPAEQICKRQRHVPMTAILK